MNGYECIQCQLRPGGLELTDHALSLCEINTGTSLLDIGCGRGDSLAYIRQKYDCTVCGLEPEPSLLAQAKKANPGITFRQAFADNIPFPEHCFDFILAECVVSLFDSPQICLKEIRRVLKPKGRLIMTDIYTRSNESAEAHGLLRHIYSQSQFIALFNEAGFQPVVFEDHSDCLKQMLGQLTLEQGAVAAYEAIGADCRAMKSMKLGYFLFIAERQDR
ncbi:membrane-associated protein [Dehalobacter sp. UNSWDHB]|uniref:DVU_1556 family methyltransferase n=1 Tax=Dehalobacter sp. UNSWDHB TaxID=1339256 RepID=UPI0003878575|nr:methyltransferase domain-containing protein [Dehalobacter sp. UNSWDHB]EQB22243.1 membrane-associated protein [Dehalobacter sp. UNSWDHB]